MRPSLKNNQRKSKKQKQKQGWDNGSAALLSNHQVLTTNTSTAKKINKWK
jgi:hypothetical protein